MNCLSNDYVAQPYIYQGMAMSEVVDKARAMAVDRFLEVRRLMAFVCNRGPRGPNMAVSRRLLSWDGSP